MAYSEFGSGETNGAENRPGEASGRPAAVHLPQQEAGPLLGGRYRLIAKLGQGGMGTVWKAHDEVINRMVAVKEPRLPAHVPEETRDIVFARLEREAQAAAKIEHPAVVSIHDVVSVDGRPWIVMELIRGQSLAETLSEGTLVPSEAARIALPVLGALTAAHRQGVLHRDVKPANVMLSGSDHVVLTDFGVAYIEGEEPLTETGSFVGSPEYTAPERVNGHRPGPASDLFSLGVLLYTAVEGFSPFHRHTSPATLQAVLGADPPAPVQAAELGPLIMRLLSKDPDSRPAPEEAEETLRRVAQQPGSGGTHAVPTTAAADVTEAGSGSRKRGSSALLAVAASAVTGAVVASLMWPGGGENDTDRQPAPASAGKPAGWETHTVQEMGVSLALPRDYEPLKRSGSVVNEAGNGDMSVTFRPGGRADAADGQVIVTRNDSRPHTEDPADTGKYWYERYMGNPKWRDTQVTLEERTADGEPCTALTMTYRNAEQTQLHRKRELYCHMDGNSWMLVVDARVGHEARPARDALFHGATGTLALVK